MHDVRTPKFYFYSAIEAAGYKLYQRAQQMLALQKGRLITDLYSGTLLYSLSTFIIIIIPSVHSCFFVCLFNMLFLWILCKYIILK